MTGLPRIAGEEYVAALAERRADRRARAAFRDRAVAMIPPGAAIFDFGCGPGLDALFYAERGFQVRAYDVDPRMCDSFIARCTAVIGSGRVALMRGTYPEFLASTFADGSIDLVTANFAPLNVIDELPELFARFHALTRPGGRVLAGLLNPSFAGDMRYAWWWRSRAEYQRCGHYALRGAAYSIHRWSHARLAMLAQPHFTLCAVHRGLPAGPLSHLAPRPLRMVSSQFLFCEFIRNQNARSALSPA